MVNTWLTSDQHFGHTNIIRYCNRPFSNAEEMDETLIANWNSQVQTGDTVYTLGDFVPFVKDWERIHAYVARLNGDIRLVLGNHDNPQALKRCPGITVLGSMHELAIPKSCLVMNHYKMAVWNRSHYGSLHIYGHSHGTSAPWKTMRGMDVGVDTNDFMLYSLEDVIERLSKISVADLPVTPPVVPGKVLLMPLR